MTSIGFPDDEFKKILSSFFALNDKAFLAVVEALPHIGNSLSFREAVESVREHIKEESIKKDISGYLSVLLSLIKTRLDNQIPVAVAAKDVAESIGIWGKAAKKTVDILQVEKRISKILSVTQLERWVKADILLHENERNYSDSKILTDIRSVFDSGDKLFSGGAVIIHQLKIKYQDNDSMEREFFLALDTSDVQKMLKTLEKAEKKATHLISKLQKEETVYYNVGKKSI